MSSDAIERPLTPNVFARLAQATRYAITGVSPDSWFGPQQPLAPQAPPDVKGRQFDYAFGANLNYIPRSEGGISFAELRALAEALPLLRAVIETRKDQVAAQNYTVRQRARADLPDASARIDKALGFLARPDRRHSFGDWLRMLIEDLLVIDAATIYPRYSRGGALYSLDIVDGATIKPLIGEDGRAPEAPDPAFQQILHGVPAADFSFDELLYLPRNKQAHRLYGMSPVEQIALTINIALRRDIATLDYYRTGSSPDAFATLPKEWTGDQIRQFQDYFDALMSGNSARRRMVKFMPSDFKLIETRQPPLKDLYDEWLAKVICYAFSVPASPFVSQVNRASGETMRLQATQEGLVPLKSWIKSALDQIIQVSMGEPGLEFVWVGDDAVDPLQQAQTLEILVGAGIKTREEARAELGLGTTAGGAPVAEDSASKALRKLNPHHDERGRFATADGAVATVGSVARKPSPRASRSRAWTNIATDAIADGGTANEATVAQMSPDAGAEGTLTPNDPSTRTESPTDADPSQPDKPAPGQKLKPVRDVPDDAVSYTTSDGTQFHAPPDAVFLKVYAAGQANRGDLKAANSSVGQFGIYEFQRKDGNFYSNYAVGVYMAGAGYSYSETLVAGALYSLIHSSNWESGLAYHIKWWTKGWTDATNGSWPISHP